MEQIAIIKPSSKNNNGSLITQILGISQDEYHLILNNFHNEGFRKNHPQYEHTFQVLDRAVNPPYPENIPECYKYYILKKREEQFQAKHRKELQGMGIRSWVSQHI